jgi:nitroreductase
MIMTSRKDLIDSKRLLDTIKRRRTCRFFKPGTMVHDRDVDMILEAARWAPSARNLQPLEYVIIRDPEKKKLISDFSRQHQPTDASVLILVIGDLKRAKSVGDVSPHDTTTHFKGLKRFLYMDASAAIQNMLLMAETLGYNTLWIGSFDEDGLETYLKLPERFTPVSIICIGKKSRDIQVPPKRVLETRLHYEKWEPKDQDESHIGFSKKINVKF